MHFASPNEMPAFVYVVLSEVSEGKARFSPFLNAEVPITVPALLPISSPKDCNLLIFKRAAAVSPRRWRPAIKCWAALSCLL